MPRFFRGAKPTARERLAGATPHQIVGTTPPELIVIPKQLDFWGNQFYGDCVTAEEAFAKSCGGIFIPAHKIIKWARNHFVLNGAGLYEVLQMMKDGGIDHDNVTYQDGAFKAVDWTNADLLKNAISQGPVKIGVAADELDPGVPNIGVSNGWIATGLTSGNPLDHCTSLCGYGTFGWIASQLGTTVPKDLEDTEGYAMFTWSTIGLIDVPSMLAITGEAWLRTPTTVQQPDKP